MNAITPISARTPETDAERRERQLAYLRELAELNMQAARFAAARIAATRIAEQPISPDPEAQSAASPTLDLARATRAVTQIVALENRIVRGEQAPRAPSADPRRPKLRQTLHPLAASEPTQSARASLRRQIDESIEDALVADPDHEVPLVEILLAITDDLGLALDPATLSDEILGIAPRARTWPAAPPDLEHHWHTQAAGPEPPNI